MRVCRYQCVGNKGIVKGRGQIYQSVFLFKFICYVWWDWDRRDRNTKLHGLLLYRFKNSPSMFLRCPRRTQEYMLIYVSLYFFPLPAGPYLAGFSQHVPKVPKKDTRRKNAHIYVYVYIYTSDTQSGTRARHNSFSCFALRLETGVLLSRNKTPVSSLRAKQLKLS